LEDRPVNYGAISPSNRVVVDKREMSGVKLVFYYPGVVGTPMVIGLAIG
jgi:hypothetical protein